MPLERFAMIIQGPGYDPAVHRTLLESRQFSTTVVCVPDFEQATAVAAELVQQGIQLIELCGGFSPEQASSLQSAIGNRVPVGVVRYSPEEQQQQALLFHPLGA